MITVTIEAPKKIITPTSGTDTFYIEILTRDENNTLVDGDAAPTIDAFVDQDGTDVSTRLGAVSNISVGRDRVIYTATAGDPDTQLRLTVSAAKTGYTGATDDATIMLEGPSTAGAQAPAMVGRADPLPTARGVAEIVTANGFVAEEVTG